MRRVAADERAVLDRPAQGHVAAAAEYGSADVEHPGGLQVDCPGQVQRPRSAADPPRRHARNGEAAAQVEGPAGQALAQNPGVAPASRVDRQRARAHRRRAVVDEPGGADGEGLARGVGRDSAIVDNRREVVVD